jgi:hypothetical protein
MATISSASLKGGATGRCRYCRCTDARACPDGCAWLDKEHTVCDSETCRSSFAAELAKIACAADPSVALLAAVGGWAAAHHGHVIVAGGINVVRHASDREYQFAVEVKCTGHMPTRAGESPSAPAKRESGIVRAAEKAGA